MTWNEAAALLEGAQRVIVVTHVSPDGDAIGTMLGLGHTLRQLGKTVTLVVDEGVPPQLRFLPGSGGVRSSLENVQADIVVAVDCSDERRMGNVGVAARALNVPLINIDHHFSNLGFGTVNLVDPQAAAAECVLDLLDAMHLPISQKVAVCLLCGLVTDTLCFRTDNTTATTLGKAQRLIEAGADLSYIVQHTVVRMATATLRLWSMVMPTIRIEDHVVWARITQEARKTVGNNGNNDTKDGGLVSLILQAEDAYISCIMHEKSKNTVDLSFRAKPGYNVSKTATELGGGGHILASGALVSGTLDEVEARVIPLLKEAAKAVPPDAS